MRELGELQPIRSAGQTVEEYFSEQMLEHVRRQLNMPLPNPSVRNEAYYAKQTQGVDPHRCEACGHWLEDPDD